MAEDENNDAAYTPVDRYPTGRNGLMLTADADQNRRKFPRTPRWRWLMGHLTSRGKRFVEMKMILISIWFNTPGV